MEYVQSGIDEGATIHYGGERIGNDGYFMQPTIFTDVKPHMRIVREEIFGPVGVIIKFEDEDDIISIANDSVYGLAAAVFSQDINRALSTAHKLKAGTVWVRINRTTTRSFVTEMVFQINCVNELHPQVPFGGFKQSGVGRELGEYALHK